MPKQEIKYFISYAHKEHKEFSIFKKEIEITLSNSDLYEFKGWTDVEIETGDIWHNKIQNNLLETQLAILCVSEAFLASSYIRKYELDVLRKNTSTIILPVYFNVCDFKERPELSQIQFFQPLGELYDEAGNQKFAFCHLVNFNKKDGAFVNNSRIQSYVLDLRKEIEAVLEANPPIEKKAPTQQMEIKIDGITGGNRQTKDINIDKALLYFIFGVMVLSALVMFYFLFAGKEMWGGSLIGVVMFFGCIAALSFIRNPKKHTV